MAEENITIAVPAPYVHVVSSKGMTYIGKLLARRELGAVVWVRLGPVYAYQLQQSPNGVVRQVAPPAFLADALEMECIAEQITYIKGQSFELEDLFRDGERARKQVQAANSQLAIPPEMATGRN